jgi:hypothetical protein
MTYYQKTIPVILCLSLLAACGSTHGDRALSGGGIGAGVGAVTSAVTGGSAIPYLCNNAGLV